MPPGRNKVPGRIKQGGGQILPTGLVFATCALDLESWRWKATVVEADLGGKTVHRVG